MKIYFQLVFLLVLIQFSHAQQSAGLTLKGDVNRVKEKIEQVMIHYKIADEFVVDSTLIKDGKYAFHLNISRPSRGSIIFRQHRGQMPAYNEGDNTFIYSIYLEPGNMTVTSIDKPSDCIVTGSPNNSDYQQWVSEAEKISKHTRPYILAMKQAMTESGDTSVKYLNLKKDFLAAYNEQMIKTGREFVNAHPNSPISLIAIASASGIPINAEAVKPLFEKLSKTIQDSEEGQELNLKIERGLRLSMGKTAPDFGFPDTSGKIVSLSSLRGKYVLVDVWASWCVNCRQEVPSMLKAFNRFKDKNFTILQVSVDELKDKDKWLKAIQKDGSGVWNQVAELKGTKGLINTLYCISGYPTNYLLDPEGKIIAQDLRGSDYEKTLAGIFNQSKK